MSRGLALHLSMSPLLPPLRVPSGFSSSPAKVPAYQVFSQPVFHMMEEALGSRWSMLKARPLPMRLVLRSLYVVGTTAVACAMPFFSGKAGVHGRAFVCAQHVRSCVPVDTSVELLHVRACACVRACVPACLCVCGGGALLRVEHYWV
jgi:hypothetical protein